MKCILLPTDFSENADNALSYAVQLYKDVECNFYILHTYTLINISANNMMDSPSVLALQGVEKEIAERKLKETENRLNTEFKNTKHKFITIASLNFLKSEMAEAIKDYDIDLVVMGTKGATGAKEIFIGTNTMDVIKKINCAVIAVPSKFKYKKPREILFPTDYKVSKSNKYLSLIRELCEEHQSRLHILNVYQNISLKETQQQTEAFLEAFFVDNVHIFHDGEGLELIEVIESFEKKYKVNFLVMVYNNHNFFENLLFKPVVNQMVYHTDIPFLVIPSEELINK
ncbi:universal stress protein, UspA family [Polaribacter sp. ALD11]|uniref:universal stress protein n=1 Tax=Polaribacter sp. ALD11 TaxID=2058137 RepID=UPI000C3023FE|nr:universal stress protein [Polaribacter sp. ALD11]AUC84619.1 universal stress protein, UspA family [Polaribacter sp. ALD11]